MTNLHDVYRLICCRIISRMRGGKVPLMSENDFYAAVLTNELKMNYPGVLNPGHHTFRQKDFDALAVKRPEAQMMLQSLFLYFISHPSAVDALCGNFHSFLTARITVIHPDWFRDGIRKWYLQLHLNPKDPLSEYLKQSMKYADPLRSCASLTTWMLLDAFCSDSHALCLLYQKYSHADKSLPAFAGCAGIISGLRILHTHAVEALKESKGKSSALHFTLSREFDRLKTIYQQSQNSCPEKYRKLFQESFSYFDSFLMDLEKKSPVPCFNLTLLENNIKKLEELLSREAL